MKVLDDGKSYNCVSYIPLSNGLKLTIDYCMFVSEGKTYYSWCYERSISMYLYYPLMVIENNNEKELTLLTIPNRISLHVSPELKLSNLLEKDIYIGNKENSMYSYNYLEDSDMSLDDKKAYVWDYYEDYNLSSRSDEFTFDYLDNRYQVKLNEATFTIIWIEKLL